VQAGGIVVFAAVTLTAAAVVYRVTSGAIRDEYRRIPPERRGLARLGFAEMLIGGIGGAVLLIVAPWGSKADVWVILALAAALMLVWVVGVLVLELRNGRRGRKRRAPNAHS
jgi:predicted permease